MYCTGPGYEDDININWMRSTCMTRDYHLLLPMVLDAMFPDETGRQAVVDILSSYGKESYHREQDRVHLGILKLARTDMDKLREFTQLACVDYRDLLCAAEYPLSSHPFDLSQKEPEKYRELQEKEVAEYEAWLEAILSA